MATWTVDPGGGGDFLTITAAKKGIPIAGGDTVIIKGGTYAEFEHPTNYPYFTIDRAFENPVIFRPADGEHVIITGKVGGNSAAIRRRPSSANFKFSQRDCAGGTMTFQNDGTEAQLFIPDQGATGYLEFDQVAFNLTGVANANAFALYYPYQATNLILREVTVLTDGANSKAMYIKGASGYAHSGLQLIDCNFISPGPPVKIEDGYLENFHISGGSYEETTNATTLPVIGCQVGSLLRGIVNFKVHDATIVNHNSDEANGQGISLGGASYYDDLNGLEFRRNKITTNDWKAGSCIHIQFGAQGVIVDDNDCDAAAHVTRITAGNPTATDGKFTITLRYEKTCTEEKTAELDHDATAETIQAALEALSDVGVGNVTCTDVGGGLAANNGYVDIDFDRDLGFMAQWLTTTALVGNAHTIGFSGAWASGVTLGKHVTGENNPTYIDGVTFTGGRYVGQRGGIGGWGGNLKNITGSNVTVLGVGAAGVSFGGSSSQYVSNVTFTNVNIPGFCSNQGFACYNGCQYFDISKVRSETRAEGLRHKGKGESDVGSSNVVFRNFWAESELSSGVMNGGCPTTVFKDGAVRSYAHQGIYNWCANGSTVQNIVCYSDEPICFKGCDGVTAKHITAVVSGTSYAIISTKNGSTKNSNLTLRDITVILNTDSQGVWNWPVSEYNEASELNVSDMHYVYPANFGTLRDIPCLTFADALNAWAQNIGGYSFPLCDADSELGIGPIVSSVMSDDYLPAESDVRNGVSYGADEYTGTCDVPAAGSVALGVPVDDTTGTAVLTQANAQAALAAELVTRTQYIEDTINDASVDSEGFSTSITMSHGEYWRVGDVIKPAGSNELLRVVSVAGDVIGVERGYLDTSEETLFDEHTLYQVGSVANRLESQYAMIAQGYTAARSAKLDNADVATSTRLATTGYTAPNNAGITAIGVAVAALPSLAQVVSGVWGYSTRTITSFNFQVADGTGDIAVDHDYGGTDELRYIYESAGVDGGRVIAYLAADYDAGNFTIRGQAVTGTDGRWIVPIYLDAGDYVLVYDKVGVYSPSIQRITVA